MCKSGAPPEDERPVWGYVGAMKNTASSPHATTQSQNKGSRQNTGPGAANASDDRSRGNAGSASQRADAAAKRGEPLAANTPNERSPKQENL